MAVAGPAYFMNRRPFVQRRFEVETAADLPAVAVVRSQDDGRHEAPEDGSGAVWIALQ
jgi:hypothetical protein